MDYILYVNKDTIAKPQPESSASGVSFPVTKGSTYHVEELKFEKGHYKWRDWYFWKGDIDIYKLNKPELMPSELTPKELTPFYTQRDNKRRPHQTCNMTSAAMVVKGFYPGLMPTIGYEQLEDEMTAYCESQYGYDGIYYHANIVKVLEHWGVKSIFGTGTHFNSVRKYLDDGNPCIYSGKFTPSGHIIVVVDYDEKGFIVNDPYGEWWSWGYENKSGERLHYSYDLFNHVSYSEEADKGWFHLCSKIDEK